MQLALAPPDAVPMLPGMAATIRDIARRAGVSAATVSRALRGSAQISAGCTERVRAAAHALAYRPLRRRRAGGGRGLRGRTLALVVLGMDPSLSGHVAIAESLRAVEAAIARAGARLLFADVPQLDALPPALAHGGVDGLLLRGALQGDAIARLEGPLAERLRRPPVVWVGGRPPGCRWGDAARSDDHAAGETAADELLAAGHRRVAVINPKPDHQLFLRRIEGFRARIRAAGGAVAVHAPAPRSTRPPYRAIDAASGVDQLVAVALAAARRPTALFAPVDAVAAEIYRALAARRLRIGREISVVSCNHDTAIVASLYPTLTTVDVRLREIGTRAVELLAARLASGGDAAPVELTVAPELVRGASVGKPA